jgi:recombination associated protein RdgC
MLLKNLVVFRLPVATDIDGDAAEQALARQPLLPCAGLQMESRGWVCPHEDGIFLYAQNRQWLMSLGVEQKLLPASIIRQVAAERAEELARKQGHPVGRKQMREVKDQVTDELLPRALSKRRTTAAWIDTVNGWLVVNAPGDARSDEFLESFRRAELGLSPRTLETQRSPASAMADWLARGEAPRGFTIDRDLELRASDASKATVRYSNHPLDGKEIRDHLSSGKTVVKLGLTWNSRVSFLLTDQLQVKRVTFLDLLEAEGGGEGHDEDERFEIDFALMTGELALLLADLVQVLGGELDRSNGLA